MLISVRPSIEVFLILQPLFRGVARVPFTARIVRPHPNRPRSCELEDDRTPLPFTILQGTVLSFLPKPW